MIFGPQIFFSSPYLYQDDILRSTFTSDFTPFLTLKVNAMFDN
jgi:hypothetical protein